MAGVCYKKTITRLIESHVRRGMLLVLSLEVDHSD